MDKRALAPVQECGWKELELEREEGGFRGRPARRLAPTILLALFPRYRTTEKIIIAFDSSLFWQI